MSQSIAASDKERVLDWVRENRYGESSEVGLASNLYETCLRVSGQLSRHYLARTEPSRGMKTRILESHTRLCLFGDELLLTSALEHCLKGDHDLREEILSLLYSLGKTLLRAPCIFRNDLLIVSTISALESLSRPHSLADIKEKAEFVLALGNLLEIATIVISQQGKQEEDLNSDSDCSEDEASELEREITRPTDDDDILSALDTYTTSLMDIRPILEQSLRDLSKPSARRIGGLPPVFYVTESARPYVLQVHDKFREAKTALVERLGEANWQRYVKTKAMMASISEERNLVEPAVPKSAFRPISRFQDSGLGTSVPNRSIYAASNASHASFLSIETEAARGSLRVPRTPIEVSEGKAFTCFICTRKISGLRNRVDWKLHVFADIYPYICTFINCPDVLTAYPTRKLWAEHEFTNHRSQKHYECHDCSRTFSTEHDFISHISNAHHFEALNHTQRLATISAAQRSASDSLSDQACPLCQKKGWKVQRDFTTHLGRHLEQIALSSLPRDEGSDSESDDSTGLEPVDDLLPLAFEPAIRPTASDDLEVYDGPARPVTKFNKRAVRPEIPVSPPPAPDSTHVQTGSVPRARFLQHPYVPRDVQHASTPMPTTPQDVSWEDVYRRKQMATPLGYQDGTSDITNIDFPPLPMAWPDRRHEAAPPSKPRGLVDFVNEDYDDEDYDTLNVGTIQCQYEGCLVMSKTPSDHKKHLARHKLLHVCYEIGCPGSQLGFATVNDLNRHMLTVHKKRLKSVRVYRCLAPGCNRSDKDWPRKDNFRSHLKKAHPQEDMEDLIMQSEAAWDRQQHGSTASNNQKIAGQDARWSTAEPDQWSTDKAPASSRLSSTSKSNNTAPFQRYHKVSDAKEEQDLDPFAVSDVDTSNYHSQDWVIDYQKSTNSFDPPDNGTENLTRPRLTNDQVDILETRFQSQPKPNSMVKRQLALQTNLTLPALLTGFKIGALKPSSKESMKSLRSTRTWKVSRDKRVFGPC